MVIEAFVPEPVVEVREVGILRWLARLRKCWFRRSDFDGHALLGEVVDDMEAADARSVGLAIMNEVH
nr:hypothetical protein [Herbaspirillum camelliae]